MMESLAACLQTERVAARDITKDLSAPRYPAGACASAAPDWVGMEAVALYATCTGRDVA